MVTARPTASAQGCRQWRGRGVARRPAEPATRRVEWPPTSVPGLLCFWRILFRVCFRAVIVDPHTEPFSVLTRRDAHPRAGKRGSLDSVIDRGACLLLPSALSPGHRQRAPGVSAGRRRRAVCRRALSGRGAGPISVTGHVRRTGPRCIRAGSFIRGLDGEQSDQGVI